MKIEIKNRCTGKVVFEHESESESRPEAIGKAVLAAIDAGASLRGTNLSDASLRGANLRGTNLIDANLRRANLIGANLRGANLRRANLRGANLRGANLRRADLSDANLICANLRGTNLSDAGVGGENCDLSSISVKHDPELPRKVANAIGQEGFDLEMGEWHQCETSHCLAGWAVHLSGPAGYALEKMTSPSVAGALLMPSAAHLFYSDNKTAKAWLDEQVAE